MTARLSMRSIFRQVLQILTKTQRQQLFKSCLAGLVNAALEWISLAAVVPIFYQLVGSGNLESFYPDFFSNASVTTLFVIILTIFLSKTILSLWLANKQLQVTNAIYIDLSDVLYQKYFQQDYASYASKNNAESFRQIKNTAFDFSNHVVHGYLVLVADVTICVVTTALLAWVDYRVVVAMFVLGAPTLILYYFFKKHWIKRIDESFRKLTPEANVILSQGIESYAEARIYHSESYFINTFLTISAKTSYLLGKLKVLSTLPARIMEVTGIACFVAVVFFGLGTTSSSEMLLMLGLLSLAIYRIMPSFNRVVSSVTQIQSYAYSVEEITELTKKETTSRTTSDKRIPFHQSIQLHDISFSYERSRSQLFNDLNITIGKGDFVLLIGRSGSGKTTFIHMLAGLISPTTGIISIDNVPLSDGNLSEWQNCIGYVPQAGVIHNDTILSNIIFTKTSYIDHVQLQRSIDVSGLDEVIKELPDGIHTKVGEHGLSLSGGQRQRLILTRALYRNPEVLLLDEVTNQLDEKSKIDVLTRLKSLADQGKTIILASHDSAVKRFATKEINLQSKAENFTTAFQ